MILKAYSTGYLFKSSVPCRRILEQPNAANAHLKFVKSSHSVCIFLGHNMRMTVRTVIRNTNMENFYFLNLHRNSNNLIFSVASFLPYSYHEKKKVFKYKVEKHHKMNPQVNIIQLQ